MCVHFVCGFVVVVVGWLFFLHNGVCLKEISVYTDYGMFSATEEFLSFCSYLS